jgi:hypothetical protein
MKKSKFVLLFGILAISLLALMGTIGQASAAPTTYDYVIITTNDILANSDRLEGFIRLKERFGYSVLVVTETEFNGLTGPPPNGRAEKIRQWLINNYVSLGIDYVLLIGNPDPDNPINASDSVGDIPMKMCWPRIHEHSYRDYPTDHFYADLTGNWNLDGDAFYGESLAFDTLQLIPSPLTGGDTFSIRWTGKLDPEHSETYSFRTNTDDGVRLWIDGDLIIDDWSTGPPRTNDASKALTAGLHDIKMEYYEYNWDAYAKLYWRSPSQTDDEWQIIPKERLYHDGSGGLEAEYYENIDFTGGPVTQIDETINFEWATGDNGPGGVNFTHDVIVGRIPENDYAQLDEILQKMIDYETIVGVEDLSWREKILLPTHPSDEVTYGWELHEKIVNDIAAPEGFTYYRIYSPGVDSPPTPPPSCEKTPCTEQNVEDEWKNGYGMVTWFTHGWETGAVNVFSTWRCTNLDDTKPSFTFQASCSNAYPETKTNLAYSLLKHGAVSTVGATRMSQYGVGYTPPSAWGVNQDFAYYYTKNIIDDEDPAGDALFQTKAGKSIWENLMAYNLYGDPACSMFDTIVNLPPDADANGPYFCSLGGTVLLDASGSYDPDFDGIILYEWDLDNDGDHEISTPNPTYSYTWLGDPLPGPINLRVTDLLGATDTATTQLTLYGVEISLTPPTVLVEPGQSALYTIDVYNLGNVQDSFDISLLFDDFDGAYRAFPTSIQLTWTTLDKTTITLDPGASDSAALTITVPHDWAGMEDATYEFTATATCLADPAADDSESAELTVQATKESMARYIDLELQWLTDMVSSSTIDETIKASLLDQLTQTTNKKEQALDYILNGRIKLANNMLKACKRIMKAYIALVEAQHDKYIPEVTANDWIATAQAIVDHIETTIATPS